MAPARRPNSLPRTIVLTGLLLAAPLACRPYEPRTFERTPVAIPESWSERTADAGADADADGNRPESGAASRPAADGPPIEPWWRTFDEPGLDAAVETAVAANLDIRQAWHRLRQAAADVVIAGSRGRPTVDVAARGAESRIDDGGARWTESLALTPSLSWELDLWGRIRSARDAASLRADATRADVSGTILLVTANVVDAWFTVQEQRALLALIEEQIAVNRTLLELTELRFSLGEGSSVEVFQQRQQVAATESAVPPVRARLAAALHRLDILLGRAPGSTLIDGDGPPDPADPADGAGGADAATDAATNAALPFGPDDTLPELPPFPPLAAPGDLLLRRPDLRAAMLRLDAADQDVAEAVADRLPRLTLDLSYDFTSTAFNRLFMREVGTIAANLIAPLADGGRRRAVVARREAAVQERLDALGATMLTALGEVEDALSDEREQVELIVRRTRQLELARATLEETRLQYVGGVGSYTDVIIAVQSLQVLERTVIGERRQLVSIRARLHQALGGLWMDQVAPATPRDLDPYTARRSDDATSPASSPPSSPSEPTP